MLKPSDNPPMVSPGFESVAEIPGRWWVAHTKARMEKRLAWDLLRRGIGYFLPVAKRTYISGGRKRRAHLPLFPSYVFFCGSEDDRYAALRTDRVARVIGVAAQRSLVSELAAIEQVLRHATLEPFPELPVGERCRIATGLFKGVEGIVLRQNSQNRRIVLQVTAIGQGAVMDLDGDLLEIVPSSGQSGWENGRSVGWSAGSHKI
jgi:transcription antitermination factor NusG